jgi:hypothetical protein
MGTGMHEMTKTAAPTIATMVRTRGSAARFCFMVRSPQYTKRAATKNQAPAQSIGRIPSEMCMA